MQSFSAHYTNKILKQPQPRVLYGQWTLQLTQSLQKTEDWRAEEKTLHLYIYWWNE